MPFPLVLSVFTNWYFEEYNVNRAFEIFLPLSSLIVPDISKVCPKAIDNTVKKNNKILLIIKSNINNSNLRFKQSFINNNINNDDYLNKFLSRLEFFYTQLKRSELEIEETKDDNKGNEKTGSSQTEKKSQEVASPQDVLNSQFRRY